MDRILVISDIHGCFQELEALLRLSSYQPDCDRLFFLGDYVDRGPQSKDVVERVMELVEQYGATALGGNHEHLFLDWLDRKDLEGDFMSNGGGHTLRSYADSYELKNLQYVRQLIENYYGDHVTFLRNLPDYHETDEFLFVHAGVDLHLKDWKNTNPFDFRWIRNRFWNAKNETGKIIVFGHTPTSYLNPDRSYHPFFFEGHERIAIDGGCAFGGQLNALEIHDSEYATLIGKRFSHFYVKK